MYAIKNDGGFTLIEFLVAVIILMVGLLGLLQSVNLAISTNKVNLLRNEAVIVADQEISRQIAKGFDLMSTNAGTSVIRRPILNSFQNYSVIRTEVPRFSNSKMLKLEVRWSYKNVGYTHDASAVLSK
ncbi:MAG: prepilin-type N-terminal cleavage/methylation domain-containing protein [Deltaproteobacteria bacterium]|nr:prepilin-type N-terminal cleavage/methylation domain-containing protein [Deltaproteobacteria bacterium]